jgi:hypothetical protein
MLTEYALGRGWYRLERLMAEHGATQSSPDSKAFVKTTAPSTAKGSLIQNAADLRDKPCAVLARLANDTKTDFTAEHRL